MVDPLEFTFATVFACSAFAACVAELCTIPLDTAKVRLQLQKRFPLEDSDGEPKYKGLLGGYNCHDSKRRRLTCTLERNHTWIASPMSLRRVKIWVVRAFKHSLLEVITRQMCPYSVNTGCSAYCAIAIVVANPTDLVKVRLQAEGKLPVGVPRRYSGALDAYYAIVKQEGVAALLTGLGPKIARNAIINAAELASYDHIKETILKIPGFTDSVLTHILSINWV
ncbi:hypothetical protein CASFOL_032777 [Castilleja foliolosa]|uniref:Uncharacterized protein n=1 Tax=Castilleja foliolosa TaxID=1961234 RepID=A0ABD3C2G1_9LAMI